MFAWSELGLSAAAGSLTTLSPCVFPLLPLVLGGAAQRHRAAPLWMGLGMATSFALVGLLLGALGGAVGLDADTVRAVGAAMLIAFGIVMAVPALSARFSQWMTPLATRAAGASARLDGGAVAGPSNGFFAGSVVRSFASSFALGGLLGLVWSPCSGPLLGSTLTLVASQAGAGRGALLLGVFGLGAAVPLVAAAYASRAGFGRVRTWVLSHAERAKKIFGVLLVLVGILVLTGGDKWLEAQVNGRLPDAWIALTTWL